MIRGLALLLPFLCASAALAFPLKREAVGLPALTAPVIVDESTEAQMWMFPKTPHRPFLVEAEPFLKVLAKYLPPSELKKIEAQEQPEGVIETSALEAMGLNVAFDENALELRIRIPLKARRSWNLNLNRWRDQSDPLRPAASSGYLNFRLNQPYQYESSLQSDSKLPLQGRVDFIQQNNGIVFETGGVYTEQAADPWVRQDTRFVVDNEKDLIRWQFGDLSSRTRGFQLTPQMGGAAAQREYSIEPERTATRISSAEILLKRDSLVEIRVNGNLFTQLRLPAGRFNLREFPLLAGQNHILVKIRDDFGEEETFEFDLLFDGEVLGAGEHEFAYQLGLPWVQAGADRTYDTTSGLLSMFHRAGITDDLTLGFNLQNYTYHYLLGAEAVKSFSFMMAAVDVASSRVLEVGGAGGRIRFQSLERVGDWEVPFRLTLSHEQITESFNPVSNITLPPNPIKARSDAQLSKNFGAHLTVSAGESWQTGFLPVDDRREWRANLIVSPTVRMRFEFSYTRQDLPVPENRGFFTFTWTDLPARTSLSAYHDSAGNTSTVNLARSNEQPYRDARWNLSYQKGDAGTLASGAFEYLGTRGAIRGEQISSQNGTVRQQTTILGLDTAIAWAGGEWTVTQPITDSFVMVTARNFPDGQNLKINPNGELAQAQLGPNTTAVVRDLVGYTKVPVNLDSTTLPPGYLLDREYYLVQPTYRSGLLIAIDLSRKILVKGRLIDSQGQPFKLISGEIVDGQGRLIDGNFFTNGDGRFLIEGLEPGDYWLVTEATKERVGLRVPNDRGQVLDLGDLKGGVR